MGISADPLVVANKKCKVFVYRMKFVFQPSISNNLNMSKRTYPCV